MTSDFTAAVVPVFLEALDLFDRAEKNKTGPVEVERATLRAAFDRAAAKMRGPRLPECDCGDGGRDFDCRHAVERSGVVGKPCLGSGAFWHAQTGN